MTETDNSEDDKLKQTKLKIDNEEELNFEKAINKLEKIVNRLESGGLNLDDSMEKFTEGVELVKYCNQELNKAEKKIEVVLKEEDEYSDIVPFQDETEEE